MSPLRERFESFVSQEPNTGCWLWTGATSPRGYGVFEIKRNNKFRAERAHRVSFELYKGVDPKQFFVCHSCDTPGCVNPDHLWLGTHSENMRDSSIKRRNRFSKRIACSRGHEYKRGTFSIRNSGKGISRRCLVCSSIYEQKRAQK